MDMSTAALDLHPSTELFLQEVLDGLGEERKQLPSKYFYDRRGSQLFDEICQLEEYYLTRTELAIMRAYGAEMAGELGSQVAMIELGSGSSVKTRMLLDHLVDPVAYLPVDISRAHLHQSAGALKRHYPHLTIRPICADFTLELELPDIAASAERRAVYLPGSTIGNLPQDFSQRLLARIAELCDVGGCLLIGIDLQKDEERILRAYNDAQGTTAKFNLNILRHINRELDADFVLENFRHEAIYSRDEDRIEMWLVSQCEQVVTVDGQEFDLAAGESICTEYSHKYTIEGFSQLSSSAGFALRRTWTDEEDAFAVLCFEVVS